MCCSGGGGDVVEVAWRMVEVAWRMVVVMVKYIMR